MDQAGKDLSTVWTKDISRAMKCSEMPELYG